MKGLTLTQITELIDERLKELRSFSKSAYNREDLEEYMLINECHNELFDIKVKLLELCINEGKVME